MKMEDQILPAEGRAQPYEPVTLAESARGHRRDDRRFYGWFQRAGEGTPQDER